MRAGRLLSLLLILKNGGRFTASDLAERLGVSQRTVLRDLEVLSGAGVPVYGVRGPGGGFELLDTFEQAVPALPPGLASVSGRLRRVRVRIAPATLQRADRIQKVFRALRRTRKSCRYDLSVTKAAQQLMLYSL